MTNFFTGILNYGLNASLNQLQYARTVMINWFAVAGISISLILVIVNISLGVYLIAGVCAGGALLFTPTLIFNKTGKYNLAGLYFVNLAILIISVSTVSAFFSGRFTETENILFAAMTLSIFLFDGAISKVQYGIALAANVALKVYKFNLQEIPLELPFILLMINVVIIAITLYAFTALFKNALFKALSQSQHQKELLYQLIDNVPLYIGIYDDQGRYAMVNKKYEDGFLLKREEIIGKRLRDIVPAENVNTYERMLQKALQGETVEFHLKTPMLSGETIYANGKYVPVFDADGKLTYVTVALYDVSKLEKIKQELEEANKAKNRLFNIVAHDIKNPLNNFEMLLNSSRNEIIGKDDFQNYIDLVKGRFEPLKRTIDGLLEWSVAQINGISSEPTLVEVKPVISDTLDLLKPHLDKKSIECKLTGQYDNLWVDPGHLKIILRNLLHNAAKFTPENGCIEVEMTKQESKQVIKISDSGNGISEELIDSILKKQVVESSAGTTGELGTGIGLNFCLELIERNQGSLSIKKNHPKGSTFEVSFDEYEQKLKAT